MPTCLIVGTDSPLRGDISEKMQSCGFCVTTAQFEPRARALVMQHAFKALIVIDSVHEKCINPRDACGKIMMERRGDLIFPLYATVVVDGRDLIDLLLHWPPKAPRPHTLIVQGRERLGELPGVHATLKAEAVRSESLLKIFGHLLEAQVA